MDSIGNRNLKKKESFQVISTLDKGKSQRTHELTEVAYTYNLCQLKVLVLQDLSSAKARKSSSTPESKTLSPVSEHFHLTKHSEGLYFVSSRRKLALTRYLVSWCPYLGVFYSPSRPQIRSGELNKI